MYIIAPKEISTSWVGETSVPAETFDSWVSDRMYQAGDVVQTADGSIWRALKPFVESNSFDETDTLYPPITIIGINPTGYNTIGFDNEGVVLPGGNTYPGFGSPWWEDLSDNPYLENRYRMLSPDPNEKTVAEERILIEITPQKQWNSFSLIDVEAQSIVVQIYRDGSLIFEKHVSTGNDYYGWYLDAENSSSETSYISSNKKDFAFYKWEDDYHGAFPGVVVGDRLVLDIQGGTIGGYNECATKELEQVSCGCLIIGEAVEIGETLFGTDLGLVDYSRKDVDTWGELEIIERGYSDSVRYSFQYDSGLISQIEAFLSSRRASPSVYVGDERYESTIVYGIYNDYRLTFDGSTISTGEIDTVSLVKDAPEPPDEYLNIFVPECTLKGGIAETGSTEVIYSRDAPYVPFACARLFAYNQQTGEFIGKGRSLYVYKEGGHISVTSHSANVTNATVTFVPTVANGYDALRIDVDNSANKTLAPHGTIDVETANCGSIQFQFLCEGNENDDVDPTPPPPPAEHIIECYQGIPGDEGTYISLGRSGDICSVSSSLLANDGLVPIFVLADGGNGSNQWKIAGRTLVAPSYFTLSYSDTQLVLNNTSSNWLNYYERTFTVSHTDYGTVTLYFM